MPSQNSQQNTGIMIGGEPLVHLSCPNPSNDRVQIRSAMFAPGHGANCLSITAHHPKHGDLDVLATLPLPELKQFLETDNPFGAKSFIYGGAFLFPYANRVRGPLDPSGKYVEAEVEGRKYLLPANWSGNEPGAEEHSNHALILTAKFSEVKTSNTADASEFSAMLRAGDFGGHWPSRTEVAVRARLTSDALELSVRGTNVGDETLPVGIGWHPYFNIPSGKREQARLRLPYGDRLEVNNYDDVFPTGKVMGIKESGYDFTPQNGKALEKIYLDDCFTGAAKGAVAEVIDPEADYRVTVTPQCDEVRAYQVYAPPFKSYVALEPQYNLPDPFSAIWKGRDTGIVRLAPGESTEWKLRVTVDFA